MICIYHSKDLDGYCSGAIVKRWHELANDYPDNVGKGELKLIGYDYGQQLSMDNIPEGEPIIMIDVSLPMQGMEKLAKHSGWKLTWIDHHVSAIKDYNNYVSNKETFVRAILEDGVSACEGGWKYLFPNQPMPEAIKLLGEYDTWRNQDKYRWDERIMPFQYGMRMICSSPETFPQEVIGAGGMGVVNRIIGNGETILKYQKLQNERACRMSFETVFEGLRAICLNNGGANSQVFDSVYDESKHDVMIPFVFTGKNWTFSFYTTKDEVDCSVIAKKYGGGGHKRAAGMQMKDLPNEFKIHIQ